MKVTETVWLDEEERELNGLVIITRAIVDVEGGGRFHGLVVCRPQRFDTRWVIYWQRTPDGVGRFVKVPV